MDTKQELLSDVTDMMNWNGDAEEEDSVDQDSTDGTQDLKVALQPFVLSTVCDDDVEGEWQNSAHALLQEVIGKGEFENRLKNQFAGAQGVSSSGFMGDLGLKLKRTKLSFLYNGGTVSPEGKRRLPRGVGGAGFLTVMKKPNIPDHPFFSRGRCFRARLRHTNLTYRDDAMLDGRVMCLKLCDHDFGGPMDFIFHTGRVSQFHSATAFEQYLGAMLGGEDTLKAWCLQQPSHYYGRVENCRREPKSYYDQRYYSHVTYEFVGEDGIVRWARLRLLPADGCEETGLLKEHDQKQVWASERRLAGENEIPAPSKDYLRVEFYERLVAAPLQYRLQLQLREVVEKEGVDFLNPCQSWDQDLYPWTDFAMLTIALPLSEEVIAKTKFNMATHPASFRLPNCHSVEDFTSLPNVTGEFHGSLEAGYIPDDVDSTFLTGYVVTVVTGKVGNAGTDADVFITLTGARGRTRTINLDNKFRDDFEAGQTDEFLIEATPVGEVFAVQVELRSRIPGREWYLEVITVRPDGTDREWRFPCYRWLTTSGQESIVLRRAEAILSHQEHSTYSFLQRKFELDERRQQYQWDKRPGLPGRILTKNYDSLPKEAKLNQEKVEDLRGKFVRTLTNTGVGTIKSLLEGWDAMNDYEKLLTSLLKEKQVVRKVAKVWMEDGEFGRQCLNGVHPTRLRRISKLPTDMGVTSDHVKALLDRDLSLEQELEAGNIYLLEFPELAAIKEAFQLQEKTRRHLVLATCLLYVRKSGELVPIAIELQENTTEAPMLWTPQDSPQDWLFAKMWLRHAEAQVHHMVSRHLKTHLVMEAISVATMRNLPAVHPVYKLLVPHLRYTIAMNVLNRQSLYHAVDGLFDKYLTAGAHHDDLMAEAYKTFTIHELHVPRDLRARGVDASSSLKDYYYREDALELWKIIKKFVRTMLMLHYWTPENVKSDDEIQSWLCDLHDNGLPCWTQTEDHGVPEDFKTVDDLIEFVTIIVYTASGHNAALTGGMMDYYGFPPNFPTVLYEPPAGDRGNVDNEFLWKALPSKTKTAEVIAAVYTLSRFSKDELFLGQYPQGHFDGEINLLTIQAFQEELESLRQRIAERNKNLDIPYPYLSPDRTPNSIAN